jgi:hypothetical protein
MLEFLIVLLPLLAVMAFVLLFAWHRPGCPDCGVRLPSFVSPFGRTRKMWLHGGCHCPHCGCETDAAGRRMADSPTTGRRAALHWVLAACLPLTGLGVVLAPKLLMPRGVEAPPVVVAPQQ